MLNMELTLFSYNVHLHQQDDKLSQNPAVSYLAIGATLKVFSPASHPYPQVIFHQQSYYHF